MLVVSSGPLPGAAPFLQRLRQAGRRYLIVSNDASRLPATTVARYQRFGLPVDEAQVLTSGMLLRDHFAAAGLGGAPTIVLGTEDSKAYVRDAGGVVVEPSDDGAAVVVVADDDGFRFLETVNATVTVLLRRLARGQRTHLVLPNPDLVFPTSPDTFGVTAGAIAAMLESVMALRDPAGAHRFVPLGKPHPPMFEAAFARFPGADRQRLVMVGDQLGTDILGANRAGVDSVLVASGVARAGEVAGSEARPTWVMESVG